LSRLSRDTNRICTSGNNSPYIYFQQFNLSLHTSSALPPCLPAQECENEDDEPDEPEN
jgi:hypothetical protein